MTSISMTDLDSWRHKIMKRMTLGLALLLGASLTTQPMAGVQAKAFDYTTTISYVVTSVEKEVVLSLNEFNQYPLTSVETAGVNISLVIETFKELDLSTFDFNLAVDRVASGKTNNIKSGDFKLENKGMVLVTTIKPNGDLQTKNQPHWTYTFTLGYTLETSKPGEYVVSFSYLVANTDEPAELIEETSSITIKFFQVPTKKR